MSAVMSRPGPIEAAGYVEGRRVYPERPLAPGWEGLRVGPDSGLTSLELEALGRTGQLEAHR